MTPPDERADLPPEQDAVRRLLAEARHDAPVPASVAARLDATLEELTADRRGSRPSAPVVDLAARRRRRVGAALLAAAAVVVAGVGVGQVLSGVDRGADDSGGAASTAESATGGGDDSLADAEVPDPDEPFLEPGLRYGAAAYRLSSDSLRRDLVAAREAEEAATPAEDGSAETYGQSGADSGCDVTDLDARVAGTVVPVTLDGRAAAAVFEDPSGGRQRVAVYLCGASSPERTVTLPAP